MKPMRSPDDPLLTVAQLAQLENTTEWRVRHMIQRCGLPNYKIGGVRIRLSEYRHWLASRRRP